MGMTLIAGMGCAILRGRAPDVEAPPPLPEVRQITFIGNTQFSARTLQAQMVTQPRPFFPPWKKGEPYNPPTLEEDLQRLKKYYFDRGFLDTVVRLEKVQEEPETGAVRLTIAIDEGEPTVVSDVRLDGPIPPELPSARALLAMLPLQPRTRLNKADFDRSRELLLARLHDAGYARAAIVPHTEVDPQAHTAVVSFELRPGAPTSFGRVSIEGAQQVAEEAIRRQLTFRPGQLYSQREVSASVERIYGLGMFLAVTPRVLNPDEPDAPMDLAFEVRERKPRSVQFGAGFSSIEGFRLQAEWIHRNIWQEADHLSFLGRFSSIEQRAEARFAMPYFRAPGLSLAQTAFARNEQDVGTQAFGIVEEAQPTFDLFSVGAESRLGYEFTRTLRGFGGLALSRNEFSDVDPAALLEFGPAIAADNFLFSPFAELAWNTTDHPLNPTRGFQLRGRLDAASSALLSSTNFFRLVTEGRHYRRVWQQVILATRLKIGGIQPSAGDDTVPFNLRFFAGGPGSVRGFTINRLGPLSARGNPIGGESLLEASVELRFPIVGELGGAVFFDVGNVFRNAFSYDLGDLRYAAGPGIRYNTPIGPIRVDVGFILDRRAGEDFGRVEFSIGQAF
jgi:outer membrane protein assembly complex protein YaeT